MTKPAAEGELIMRRFRCGKCGSLPGERCRNKSGVALTGSHSDRYWQARAAGLLPLADDAAGSRRLEAQK